MKVTKNRKEALIQKRLFPSRKTPYRSELDMIEESPLIKNGALKE